MILGLERTEPTQAKPLWSGTTPGAERDRPGSGALGHWMKKCWEMRSQRTASQPSAPRVHAAAMESAGCMLRLP